jgi:hypothetical protein
VIISGHFDFTEIADRHNAALAAAHKAGWHECNAEDLRKFEQFEQQLAAEREKMKALERSLEAIRNHADGHNRNHCIGCSFSFNTATQALAKVKGAK